VQSTTSTANSVKVERKRNDLLGSYNVDSKDHIAFWKNFAVWVRQQISLSLVFHGIMSLVSGGSNESTFSRTTRK
jgi:hypothetical protein